MKRSLINFALCAVAIAPVVSCSNEDMSREEKKQIAITQMITEGMKSSDQGITLTGAAVTDESVDSRGAIYSTSNGFFETEKDDAGYNKPTIGIMMLAKNIIAASIDKYEEYGPYNYLNVDWSTPKAGSSDSYLFDDTWSVYLPNVPASASYKTVEDPGTSKIDTVGTVLKLDLQKTDSRNYYPLGAYHNYWFYGYAPIQNGANVKYSPNQVSVLFDNLDGSQDVILGKAEPSTNDPYYDFAYSAKYFRYSTNRQIITDEDGVKHDVAKPVTMNFKHKMMQIRFWIKAGGTPLNEPTAENRDYTEAYKTRVVNISVTNVPQVMQLIVASKDNTVSEKENFIPAEGTAHNREIFVKKLVDDKDPKGYVFPKPTVEGALPHTSDNIPAETQVGDGLLVPVLNDLVNNPYMINVELEYPAGSGTMHKLLVPMRLPVDAAKTYFEQGKIYDVYLTIYSPEAINLNATLDQWKEAAVSPFITVEGGTFPIH